MYTGEREFWRFVWLCVRLALWKNAVVFSPTAGNMECRAFSRGQILRFLVATLPRSRHREND